MAKIKITNESETSVSVTPYKFEDRQKLASDGADVQLAPGASADFDVANEAVGLDVQEVVANTASEESSEEKAAA